MFEIILSSFTKPNINKVIRYSILESGFFKTRGVILCQDDFSRKWIRENIDQIEIEGKNFKAWFTGERGDVIDATVILGPALDKCPEPKDVIYRALGNAGNAIFPY